MRHAILITTHDNVEISKIYCLCMMIKILIFIFN